MECSFLYFVMSCFNSGTKTCFLMTMNDNDINVFSVTTVSKNVCSRKCHARIVINMCVYIYIYIYIYIYSLKTAYVDQCPEDRLM